MLLVFLLIACAVAAWVLLRPPVFQAEARINIPEIKKEDVADQQMQKTSPLPFPSNAPAQQGISLQTAVEILQGNVLAEKVMTTLGITTLFPGLEQNTQGEKDFLAHALTIFQQQLTITPIKDTRIIQISFQHHEAELSAQVVETLIRLFQKEYRKFQSPEESRQNEQLLFARQQMHQKTRALSMFHQKNQFLLVREAPDKLTEQYDMIKTLLSSEQKNLQKQSDQLKSLEEAFADTLKFDQHDKQHNKQQERTEELSGARKDLIRLKLYEQELRKKYGEGGSGDRLIANVGLQIASLEKLLYAKAAVTEAEQKKIADTAEEIVTARIAYHNQQKKTELLQRQVRQIENKLQRVTEQDGVLGELQQQTETTRKRYASLVEQLETEKKLREHSEQIRIIEKPVVPPNPIKPKQKPALLLALISGLIGSILYGMLQLLRKSGSNNASIS